MNKKKYLINVSAYNMKDLINGHTSSVSYILRNYDYYTSSIIHKDDIEDNITLDQFELLYFSEYEFNNFALVEITSSESELNKCKSSDILSCNLLSNFSIKSFNEIEKIAKENEATLIINKNILLLALDQKLINVDSYNINGKFMLGYDYYNIIDLNSVNIMSFIYALYNDGILDLETDLINIILDKMDNSLKLTTAVNFKHILKKYNIEIVEKLLNNSTLNCYLTTFDIEDFLDLMIEFNLFDKFIKEMGKCKTQNYLTNISSLVYKSYDKVKSYFNDDKKFEKFIERVIKILEKNNIYNNLENLTYILLKNPNMIKYCNVDKNILIYKANNLASNKEFENLLKFLEVERIPEYVKRYISGIKYTNQINAVFTFIQFADENDVVPYLNIYANEFINILGPTRGNLIYGLIPFYKKERITLFMKSVFNMLEYKNNKQIKTVLKYLKLSPEFSEFVTTENMEGLKKVPSNYINDILL